MNQCRKGKYDKANCYSHWDHYPCWVKKKGVCYNKEGNTQFLDPTGLTDVLRYISNIIGYVNNAFVTAITNSDSTEDEQSEAQTHYYHFLHDFTTTLTPLQNPSLQLVDYGRYYNSDEYLDKAEQAVHKLENKIKEMRRNRNVQNVVPDLIERPGPLERVESRGNKKKTKKQRNKHKYKYKTKRKNKII